jgi:hypothetical protein
VRSKRGVGEGAGGGKVAGRGKWGEMTQTLYAHMNKTKIKKIYNSLGVCVCVCMCVCWMCMDIIVMVWVKVKRRTAEKNHLPKGYFLYAFKEILFKWSYTPSGDSDTNYELWRVPEVFIPHLSMS